MSLSEHVRMRQRISSARYRALYPDRALESQRRYEGKRDHAARAKAWREANPDKRRAYNAANIKRRVEQNRKRDAALRQATPAWADRSEITRIYALAACEGLDVDHIVPVLSPLVCGLHCPANLAPIDPIAGRKKGNRWWPDMPKETDHL